jgi:hypothetical protein
MSHKASEGLISAEIPNAHVASAASQYRESAEILFRQPPQILCRLPLPLMNVCALALELYLKSLNSKNEYHDLEREIGLKSGYRVTAEPVQRDHSLLNLYDGLDPKIQNELHQFYAATPAVPGAVTFRDALQVYPNLFLYSRYPFENQWSERQGTVIDHLVALVRLMGRFVERLPKSVVR